MSKVHRNTPNWLQALWKSARDQEKETEKETEREREKERERENRLYSPRCFLRGSQPMRSEWAPRVGGDSSAPTGDVITRGRVRSVPSSSLTILTLWATSSSSSVMSSPFYLSSTLHSRSPPLRLTAKSPRGSRGRARTTFFPLSDRFRDHVSRARPIKTRREETTRALPTTIALRNLRRRRSQPGR